MSISDPILNCLTEVCCGAAEAEAQLAVTLVDEGVCEDAAHAKKCAKWMFEYFDLAPKGSLKDFKKEIARLARG